MSQVTTNGVDIEIRPEGPPAPVDVTPDQLQARPTVTMTKDIVIDRGRGIAVPGIQIGDKRLIMHGRMLTIARLKDEWYDDIGDPETIIRALKASSAKPDILTFWQRLPDTVPLYPYYQEPDALSALPLTSYDHWWKEQIRTDTRKKVKRPEKRGIEIKEVGLDDEFVRGVMGVFNETPVRRGKPFWHYGKSFERLKEDLARDISISKFIGAYYQGSLVGVVKLVYAEGRFANPGFIISKIEFRNKYVNNALMAKAVEVCTRDGIPYLTYTNWRRGSQAEFLVRNGFEKTLMPRYWVPLTVKGTMAMKLGLHRNIRSYIPDRVMSVLLEFRGSYYNWRYKTNREEN